MYNSTTYKIVQIPTGSVGINSEHSLYEAVVGSTISLGIHVAGFPPLSAEEIEWHNPHDSVIASGRALTLLNNKTRLQIQGVQFTDNGTYSIQINRPFHNVSTTIDLIVHSKSLLFFTSKEVISHLYSQSSEVSLLVILLESL